MKFLIDNNLSPKLSNFLFSIGHDSKHVKELKLEAADDRQIFELAYMENRTIVTADTDFGYILSNWDYNSPSIILFRHFTYNPQKQFDTLKIILPHAEDDILKGSIIVIEPSRYRIKRLPF